MTVDLSLVDHEGDTIHVRIQTDAGLVEIVSDYVIVGRRITLQDAHIQGLSAGALGRRGLNAIAREIMEQADADVLEIHGAVRTTDRKPGARPRPITVRR